MPANPGTFRRSAIRVAALAFGLFIIAVIVIADRGQGANWWPFLERIPYGDKFGHVGLFGKQGLLIGS